MTIREHPKTLPPQRRAVTLQLKRDAAAADGGVDLEGRTVDLAFSSEAPIDMWYGTEILSHAPGAMRTGVRQQTMSLLFNHDRDDLLGVVESVAIGNDRRGRAVVRFGKDERGDWAMKQVADGVLVNVSFMYRVFKLVEDTEAETLTAIDWEVYEISLVTIPADATVGVGRSADISTENGVQIERSAAATTPASESEPGVTLAPGAHSALSSTTRQEPFMPQVKDPAATDGGQSGDAGNTAVDTRAVELRGAEGERARIAEIEAMAKRFNLPAELRAGLVTKGSSVEQARMAAFDHVMERAGKVNPTVDLGQTHNPDLSQSEKARYSMIRAVNAAISNDWKTAGFELECSNEIAKRLQRGPQHERSFFVPTNITWAARAAYAVGTPGAGTTGGTLVATDLLTGSFIEVLRNKARVMQLGATIISGLVGSVDIPRQTGQSSTFWTAEGVNTTESEATFDKVSLAMKTIGTYSQISRNMLMQSTPDIDMLARADLIAAMGLGVDLATLSGTGSGGQPLGVANTSGIGSVVGGTNGAAITIDNYIDLETAVTNANVPEESLAYLANAKTVGSTKKLKSTTGQYLWTNAPGGQRTGTPGEINGYPVARSNQARSTLTKGSSSGVCSELFFGAWSEVLIGEWGVLEILPNPFDAAAYKNGAILLRVLQSLDIAVRHAASFATMSDALTP